MKRRNELFFSLLVMVFLLPVDLFGGDTLLMNRKMCESRFLSENLLLIAGRLDIEKAEAMAIQARYWPNPTLSADEINLWATQSQLGYFGEELPPLFGDFGRNRQLSVELEQLILTAGKRKKRVALEQVNVRIEASLFEDLLRNLKWEFRSMLTQLQYLQQKLDVYAAQRESISLLIIGFERQHAEGHIGIGELVRLRALALEYSREVYELSAEVNRTRRNIAALLNLPAETVLLLTTDDYTPDNGQLRDLQVAGLLDQALNHRPDLEAHALTGEYYRQLHRLERANRIPDITLKGGYDRGGNFMLNFIGAGISVDLPLFDRNRGNMLYASHGIRQAEVLLEHKTTEVRHEVMMAYRNYLLALEFYSGIDPGYDTTLDALMERYNHNFSLRNISLLEYIDFMQAYTDNKNIILEAVRDLNERIEELQYVLGADIQ